MNLCSYGCGKEAVHQFKNGKYCCNYSRNKCISQRKLNSENTKGRIVSSETRNKLRNLILGKVSNMKGKFHSKETKEKMSLKAKGRIPWIKGKHHSEESKDKCSKSQKGKKWEEIMKDKEKIISRKEKQRQRCLNGNSSHMLSFVNCPSKPQIELYNLVKELHKEAEIEYWVKEVNKRIDIGIESLKIAIEYDGSFWHQDKEYDDKRQKLLENFGWKFIRYVDYIPTKEQVELDINKLIQEGI